MSDEILLRDAQIMIVDDQASNVRLLETILRSEGYTRLTGVIDSRRAASLFASLQPDLLLLDLMMPNLDGFEVIKQIKPLIPDGSYVPILALTADISRETRQQALCIGAKDFLTKPFDHTEVLLRIKNLLETRLLHTMLQNQNRTLDEKVQERTQELAGARKQIEAERERLASILEQLPVGVLIAEGGPKIHRMRWSFVNQVGREQVLGLRPSETMHIVPGSVASETFTTAEANSFLGRAEEILAHNVLWTGQARPDEEIEFHYENGEECVFLATSALLREDEDTREAVVVLQDITERKRLEHQKDDFIGLASHELRTPLTVIKGYARLALNQANKLGDKRLAHMMELIDGRVDHLTQLASVLLDVSRLQRGTLLLDKRQFDLLLLVQEVASDLRIVASEFTISSDISSESVMVSADRQRIGQVVANLLNNAIKYSGKSRKVEINVTSTDGEVVTVVRDSGMGIPANKQPRVFERFFQAGDISSHQSGLGLGLFISRDIIESHGGRMWFESSEGAGSTFYFSLPLVETNKEHRSEARPVPAHGVGEQIADWG